MTKNLNCQTGLKPESINREVFEKELELCKKLNKKNSGSCGWGKCNSCGVIPLLYKLYKGELIEDSKQIQDIKNNLFN